MAGKTLTYDVVDFSKEMRKWQLKKIHALYHVDSVYTIQTRWMFCCCSSYLDHWLESQGLVILMNKMRLHHHKRGPYHIILIFQIERIRIRMKSPINEQFHKSKCIIQFQFSYLINKCIHIINLFKAGHSNGRKRIKNGYCHDATTHVTFHM